jgi:hypothetical protein
VRGRELLPGRLHHRGAVPGRVLLRHRGVCGGAMPGVPGGGRCAAGRVPVRLLLRAGRAGAGAVPGGELLSGQLVAADDVRERLRVRGGAAVCTRGVPVRVQVLLRRPGPAGLRRSLVLPAWLRPDAQRAGLLPTWELLPEQPHVRAAAVPGGYDVGPAAVRLHPLRRQALLPQPRHAPPHPAYLPGQVLLSCWGERPHPVSPRQLLQHRRIGPHPVQLRLLLPSRVRRADAMPDRVPLSGGGRHAHAMLRRLHLSAGDVRSRAVLVRDLLRGRRRRRGAVLGRELLPGRRDGGGSLHGRSVLQRNGRVYWGAMRAWHFQRGHGAGGVHRLRRRQDHHGARRDRRLAVCDATSPEVNGCGRSGWNPIKGSLAPAGLVLEQSHPSAVSPNILDGVLLAPSPPPCFVLT